MTVHHLATSYLRPGLPMGRRRVELRSKMIRIGAGIAFENVAAWRCTCGRGIWLIGRIGDVRSERDMRVHCPDCGGKYLVTPEKDDRESVSHIEKL